MKASIIDLRYKMNDVLKALDRNEQVTVLYRGKVKGILIPSGNRSSMGMKEHPFFGMSKAVAETTVEAEMAALRGARYDDL
ncbi:MAG: hypothetical protein WC799_12510 [Desulfobacteraceae bacterium]|jgi:hypothetical protein